MNDRRTLRPARAAVLGPAAALLAAAGCQLNPFARPEDDLVGPSLAELHEIEGIDLAERSRSEPVSLQEAAEDAVALEPPEPGPPPETAELSLERLRASTLDGNLDLKVELVNPSIAQSDVDAEEAKFESTFTGAARQTHVEEPVEFATESSTADFSDFDLGVEIPLRTGGFITVDFPLGRSDTDNPFSLVNPAFDTAVRFSISQPLLRGVGVEANTASIKVARYQRRMTDARTKLEAIRILANADRAYWLLYAAQQQLEVRQQQYELAVEQLERARRRVAAGEDAEIETIRAASGVASSLEDIIVARMVMRRRQRDLKRIMHDPALPMGSPTSLVLTTEPSPVYLDLDPEALGELAVTNRMEMLELELQLAADAVTIDLRRNETLPLVSVDYAYDVRGRSTTFGRAFDQIADRSFTGWTVGLTAEIPIGNEAARARLQGAILTRLQRLATRDRRRLAILQEVYDAVDRLDQEWQRILAARQAVILAARTYEAEKRQFEVGMRTSTDVLDAAARLADAQSAEVLALADYEIARVDIAFGTGTLLGYDRIRWEPTGLE